MVAVTGVLVKSWGLPSWGNRGLRRGPKVNEGRACGPPSPSVPTLLHLVASGSLIACFVFPSHPSLRMWPGFPQLPTSCASWLPPGSPAASCLWEGRLPVPSCLWFGSFPGDFSFSPSSPFGCFCLFRSYRASAPPSPSETLYSPASSFPNSGPLEYYFF